MIYPKSLQRAYDTVGYCQLANFGNPLCMRFAAKLRVNHCSNLQFHRWVQILLLLPIDLDNRTCHGLMPLGLLQAKGFGIPDLPISPGICKIFFQRFLRLSIVNILRCSSIESLPDSYANVRCSLEPVHPVSLSKLPSFSGRMFQIHCSPLTF